MVKKGKWTVPGVYRVFLSMDILLSDRPFPGYKEKFGDLNLM
jgi:hypothetical protein